MRGHENGDAQSIRVTLELRRSDDPVLFDALASLEKGRRRVARLRTLAHDGLVVNMAPVARESRPARAEDKRFAVEQDDLADIPAAVTGGVFDPPLLP